MLYASHSFRIGTARTAAEAGVRPWLIQTLGRWSSKCFTLYIRTPPSILQKVPRMLATSHPSGQGIWNSLPGHSTAPVVFHNCLVTLAVFGIFFWMHICHFHYLHVAGWVGPLPHLSFHSLPGGAAPHSLAHLLPCRVCVCHHYFIFHF